MASLVRFRKPALRTGRPLAVAAAVLPGRHTASRNDGMIDLRTPHGGSRVGPSRWPIGGRSGTGCPRLPRPRLRWPRCRRFGGQKLAGKRDRNHPHEPAAAGPPLAREKEFTHESIHIQ
jgi:hypothetical protein